MMYHLTPAEHVSSIMERGLLTNRRTDWPDCLSWTFSFYLCNPVFLTNRNSSFIDGAGKHFRKNKVWLEVDVEGLELLPDFASLADLHVMYVERKQAVLFSPKAAKALSELMGGERRDTIPFTSLLDTDNPEVEAVIAMTGTAACVCDIAPERIRVLGSEEDRLAA